MNSKKYCIYYGSLFLISMLDFLLGVLKRLKFKKAYFYFLSKIIKSFDDDFYSEREEYCPIKKKKVINVIIALPSRGCEYFFKNGGCAMCGFNNEIIKYKLNLVHPLVIDFLVKVFIDYFSLVYKHRKESSILSIFMAGSFFNVNEFPESSQKKVLDYFSNSNFEKLFLESRAEYILKYSQNIIFYRKQIDLLKEIEISLGLESSDDFVRNKIIKKGLTKKNFEKAVSILKNENILVSAYVLVGGPYLSEKEILKKSISTIEYLWTSGVDIANIEIYCVQEKTGWLELYKKGIFEPVSLWAVIDLLRSLDGMNGQWRLGGFSDWPKPLKCPDSCEVCKDSLLGVIRSIREDHDFEDLYSLDSCSCRAKGVIL